MLNQTTDNSPDMDMGFDVASYNIPEPSCQSCMTSSTLEEDARYLETLPPATEGCANLDFSTASGASMDDALMDVCTHIEFNALLPLAMDWDNSMVTEPQSASTIFDVDAEMLTEEEEIEREIEEYINPLEVRIGQAMLTTFSGYETEEESENDSEPEYADAKSDAETDIALNHELETNNTPGGRFAGDRPYIVSRRKSVFINTEPTLWWNPMDEADLEGIELTEEDLLGCIFHKMNLEQDIFMCTKLQPEASDPDRRRFILKEYVRGTKTLLTIKALKKYYPKKADREAKITDIAMANDVGDIAPWEPLDKFLRLWASIVYARGETDLLGHTRKRQDIPFPNLDLLKIEVAEIQARNKKKLTVLLERANISARKLRPYFKEAEDMAMALCEPESVQIVRATG